MKRSAYIRALAYAIGTSKPEAEFAQDRDIAAAKEHLAGIGIKEPELYTGTMAANHRPGAVHHDLRSKP